MKKILCFNNELYYSLKGNAFYKLQGVFEEFTSKCVYKIEKFIYPTKWHKGKRLEKFLEKEWSKFTDWLVYWGFDFADNDLYKFEESNRILQRIEKKFDSSEMVEVFMTPANETTEQYFNSVYYYERKED